MEHALVVTSRLQTAFPPELMEQIIPYVVLVVAMALGFTLRTLRQDRPTED
jgi:hypothetical protein